MAEQKIGHPLTRSDIVHHINGIKTDNRPENLMVCNGNEDHFSHHRGPNTKHTRPVGGENPVIECGCGCGADLKKYDEYGRFVH